jgi:hypothetical protein
VTGRRMLVKIEPPCGFPGALESRRMIQPDPEARTRHPWKPGLGVLRVSGLDPRDPPTIEPLKASLVNGMVRSARATVRPPRPPSDVRPRQPAFRFRRQGTTSFFTMAFANQGPSSSRRRASGNG